jgi:beta-1,2-mannobiose phosphorylase / 1,2-beta-oligomannan phosphorylase
MARKKKYPKIKNIKLLLERFKDNPILKPNPGHAWESKAVFNPAAIYAGNKVHIVYRAIGDNDNSVLGYTSTTDGLHVEKPLTYPVYTPREPFEGADPSLCTEPGKYSPFASGGGGMGGCEDPRLTKIDDKIYLTYVAYDGHSPPRVALSSILYNDFLKRRWKWKRPVLISPPGIIDKNACILPEKINGKYVIFHRIFPNILIDYVDDLDFDGKTKWLTGQFEIPVRALSSDWDSRKVGCGAPPIKTKEGWLLIYQAVGNCGEYRYKIGAMLLDLKDPTKVIARSQKPILEPDAWYENQGWKSGVIYPCGAAVIKDRLFVYYGGADMVVCVASAKLNGFLEELVTNHREPAVENKISAVVEKPVEKLKPCRRLKSKSPAKQLIINVRKKRRPVSDETIIEKRERPSVQVKKKQRISPKEAIAKGQEKPLAGTKGVEK